MFPFNPSSIASPTSFSSDANVISLDSPPSSSSSAQKKPKKRSGPSDAVPFSCVKSIKVEEERPGTMNHPSNEKPNSAGGSLFRSMAQETDFNPMIPSFQFQEEDDLIVSLPYGGFELTCVICKEPTFQPALIHHNCPHTVCMSCWARVCDDTHRWDATTREYVVQCPLRCRVGEGTHSDPTYFKPIANQVDGNKKRLMEALVLRCPNHRLGCSFTCKLGSSFLAIQRHVETCSFHAPLEGSCKHCGTLMLQTGFSHHLLHVCPEAPWLCHSCGITMPQRELKAHRIDVPDECVNHMTCPDCHTKGVKQTDHNKTCPEQIIFCSSDRCFHSCKRRDLDHHLNDPSYLSLHYVPIRDYLALALQVSKLQSQVESLFLSSSQNQPALNSLSSDQQREGEGERLEGLVQSLNPEPMSVWNFLKHHGPSYTQFYRNGSRVKFHRYFLVQRQVQPNALIMDTFIYQGSRFRFFLEYGPQHGFKIVFNSSYSDSLPRSLRFSGSFDIQNRFGATVLSRPSVSLNLFHESLSLSHDSDFLKNLNCLDQNRTHFAFSVALKGEIIDSSI